MSIPRATLTYFGLVFGAGFVLGTIRVLLLVPRVSERTAELIETPFMILVVLLSARFVTRRMRAPTVANRLAVGFAALLLLLLAELAVVLFLRGEPLTEYIEARDSVSGVVYLFSLGLYALAPMLVRRTGVSHG